mmetsp:Transcript_791/g.3262  ORF Transcript_791/g.3262 Transcript_791/m.3262 type:complete len:270 (+) Transcript_791:1345-2154(+)
MHDREDDCALLRPLQTGRRRRRRRRRGPPPPIRVLLLFVGPVRLLLVAWAGQRVHGVSGIVVGPLLHDHFVVFFIVVVDGLLHALRSVLVVCTTSNAANLHDRDYHRLGNRAELAVAWHEADDHAVLHVNDEEVFAQRLRREFDTRLSYRRVFFISLQLFLVFGLVLVRVRVFVFGFVCVFVFVFGFGSVLLRILVLRHVGILSRAGLGLRAVFIARVGRSSIEECSDSVLARAVISWFFGFLEGVDQGIQHIRNGALSIHSDAHEERP